jgi:LysM repeat protein
MHGGHFFIFFSTKSYLCWTKSTFNVRMRALAQKLCITKTTNCGAGSMKNLTAALVAATLSVFTVPAMAQQASLVGSRASMERQHQHAVHAGYTFSRTSRAVNQLVEAGELVRVNPTQHVAIHNVSYPYAKPAVKTLIERLGTQYFNACGEKLTVTSLTRPIERQPANAASDSVHPTGMAVDLRIPQKQSCRTWLERTLLALEENEILDVTRERNPPHYHVAVFPEPYVNYLAGVQGQSREYTVRRGDTLSRVASTMGTTVAQLRSANGLRGDLINVGQKLVVPGTGNENSVAGARVIAASANTDQISAASRAPQEITHQVRRGETLWRIANRYRTSVDAIRSQNDLAGDLLSVGQVLRVAME